MKNKLLVLLKTNIVNSFKLKAMTIKKKILFSILIAYVVCACVVTLAMFMNTFFDTLTKANLVEYFIPFVFAFASLITIVFTIFSAKAWLFENGDNDLLLSLPIKRSTILLNRLLYLCLLNFMIGLLVIIPGLYIYLSNMSGNTMFYVSVIFMILFFPIIPTVIASIFGFLIAFITSKAKNKNIVELLSYTIFIVAYMYVFTNSNTIMTKLASNPILMERILKILFLPIYLIGKGIINNNFIYIVYFVITNLIIVFLFTAILNKSYFKIISKLSAHQTKSNFKMHKLAIKSQKKALKQKEIKRYFSSAIYVFNTLFGVVLILIVAIASNFYSYNKIAALMGSDIELTSFKLVFFLFLFSVALTNTTSSSISIERNNFWILKMLPVESKDIFKAKIFVNRIIVIPAAAISLPIFMISGYINYVEMVLLLVFAIFFNFFVSNLGLIANLLFPRLDAINDTVIVKQSVSSLVGILVPFFIAMGAIAVMISTNISNNIIIVITIVISAILYAVTDVIIKTWGIKRFKQIG